MLFPKTIGTLLALTKKIQLSVIKMKDNPTFIKLKKIFNDADREEKKEAW